MTPSEVCCAYLAAFEGADPEGILQYVADDFVNEHTAALGTSCTGKREYADRLPAFLVSMPGLHYAVEDVVAEGRRVVVAYTLHADVDAHPIAVRGVMRFAVDDRGLIVHRVDYWDSQVFTRQAGLA